MVESYFWTAVNGPRTTSSSLAQEMSCKPTRGGHIGKNSPAAGAEGFLYALHSLCIGLGHPQGALGAF
ncbi:uncharacterized protein L3040_003421 [Drepanopeziza brunnea f. sp. 'multigermtubi']|uniref:uncharacterized protein n=1 Tax=Drepanopeziza brunnea f. sp. 'multigermtubi' TaxID=698441 RepID=UPI0023821CC0|nr:hypothetical protein L3040_003421 [Drepanopeziza brunnea f. sp. 'multigermtubi']